jgi:cap2 methyltransferase
VSVLLKLENFWQGDPGRQESIVSSLLESEAVAALSILAPGGALLIKMFTMFESETVCLMYLLSIAFTQVEVFKPATSKEGNSEVYVVCKDFQKTEWIEKFLSSVKE